MMRSCGGVTSSLHRSRYVGWSVESPAPVKSVGGPGEFSHQTHQLTGSGSIPLLLLSPPEANSAFSHQCSQSAFPKRLNHQACSSSTLHNTDNPTTHCSDEGEDSENKHDPSDLCPENENSLLPRSSPVISRRHRPVSWHGGEADTSNPSSLDSLSPQDQRPTVGSMEELGSRPTSYHRSCLLEEDKKQRCVSISSHLNNFLISLFHLPFSGQQEKAEDHRGRALTSCNALRSPDLSTLRKTSAERRSGGIPEFPSNFFKSSCELEKENAHFIVVDMVLEVLEGVKWTLSLERRTAADCSTCTQRDTNSQPHGHKLRAFRHLGVCKPENIKRRPLDVRTSHKNDAEMKEARHQLKTFSVLSTDSGFEDYGGDTMPTHEGFPTSAESLAQELVEEFRRSWLPSHELHRGRKSLRSSLQELPGTESVVVSSGSLTEEIRLRTRMRGSLRWAPPRFQIIFTVQPTHRRRDVVALQNFLCAGCGTKVEPKYIKKLRYCEYLGRYFCDCCHSGSEAVIPGRVLSCWDFARFPVSDFSKQLLDSVWFQPLFDLTCVGKKLYSRVKELDKFRELQDQLMCIKKLLKACRLSGSVMTQFEQLPAHLLEQPHFFSMDDLLRVKKGQLMLQGRAVLTSAIDHVENCKLCLARGFICEFCRKRDVIFPFQTEICRRCPDCKTCFHKHCFGGKKCPKCARIKSRKKRSDGSMKCDKPTSPY